MPEPAPLKCGRCGTTAPPRLSWTKLSDTRHHLRAECAACGAWLTWLPQTIENVRAAGGWPDLSQEPEEGAA